MLSLDGLGDMVLRQPLLRGLVDAGYEVHVLVQAGYEGLLRLLDERLHAIGAPVSWTSPPTVPTVRALFDALRRLDPALVVSAQFNPVCPTSIGPTANGTGQNWKDAAGCTTTGRR